MTTGYVVARAFDVDGYVPDADHRRSLDALTNQLMDVLLDREGEVSFLLDSDVTVDLGTGEVAVAILVKTGERGAADALAAKKSPRHSN